MSPSFKWHFPTTDWGDKDAINDPLRSTFEGRHEYYIARESIQNSLDAKRKGETSVHVTFERFNIAKREVPGLAELVSVIQAAKEFSKDEDKSEQEYGTALRVLNDDNISILKISDYNTTGLTGDDELKSGGWYKLLETTGANSMSGDGGGSFGIGKGAPFAASLLRTVYYSTINDKDEFKFAGKARISSFRNEEGDIRHGIGQFGEEVTGRGVRSVTDPNSLPGYFKRDVKGTDVYVLGYRTDESDWTSLLLNSILNNFWAAIHFGELTVDLKENGELKHQINNETLGELMAEFAAGSGDSYEYFQAVINPTVYEKGDLPLLKDVELYIRLGEGLPKDVQLMRKTKMSITKIENYRVLTEPYVAVFICKSEDGNKLLRSLEPPTHDQWVPELGDQILGDKLGTRVIKEYREWIKQSLRKLAEQFVTEPEDIPDLSKWLPEVDERDDLKSFTGSFGERTDQVRDEESPVEVGAQKPREEFETMTGQKRELNLTQNFERGDGPAPLGTQNRNNREKNATIDPTKPGVLPRINTADIRFRAREIFVDGKRKYKVILTSQEEQTGSIKLLAVGDDSDFPLEISTVFDQNNNQVDTKDSEIKGITLPANEPVTLVVELTNQNRYSLGVE